MPGSYKELVSHHSLPYNKKELENLQMSDFSWTHQRTEFAGQTATPKFTVTGEFRESQLRSMYLEQKPLEPLTSRNTLTVILTNC